MMLSTHGNRKAPESLCSIVDSKAESQDLAVHLKRLLVVSQDAKSAVRSITTRSP